ncbi:uncharacterized protein LOC135843878 isoform X2 [Planococcus citri]|uniref:uncharacterized protein LOC135843878 isoform X2 n=1 Tax=Planococcus citri TaxID=170843 RepID=UPI0031F7FEB8
MRLLSFGILFLTVNLINARPCADEHLDGFKLVSDALEKRKNQFKGMSDNEKTDFLYKALDKLDNLLVEFEEEKRLRTELQSLLDFGELIEGFVAEAYPKWAGPRSPKSYTEQVWENVLLNIENPRVLFVKKELEKAGLLETDFIKIMNDFLQGRNYNARYMMTPKERETAYPALLGISNDPQRLVIRLILDFAYNFKKDNKIELKPISDKGNVPPPATPDPDADLIAEIVSKTQVKRSALKLLQLQSPKTYYYNEHEVEEVKFELRT